MNDDGPPSTDEASAETCDESEVARVFDAYLAELEAGRPVDPARLLADHPAIAEELRACLDVMHLADQMAKGSGAIPVESRTPSHSPAPGTSRVVSLLTSLGLGTAEIPQVLLRELPDESERLARPRSTEMPPSGASVNRYQVQGEIARGGMGAILKGRDIDLGRDLAIKVMLEAHRGNSEVVRRFVEEAQIGGQLQHPGIVPVYELGTFADRRPYFAMKLVKGRTLASLLAERKDGFRHGSLQPSHHKTPGLPPPHHDLPRFLSIFEAVCQTIAYAHARGVIHRDLKPSNVMVGSFGEVQVMDWGLAKVLPQGGVADEGVSQQIHETIIVTVRSGSSGSGSESQTGSVLGTPAYMAPEQARGEMDRIDERADVFGLGAILCEVLTGQSPFVATSREEIRAQAARGDMADALGRLEHCGADGELIELARSCLRSERDRRPRNAGEVAGRITAYLVGVQERLRAAELGRVEAQTRAEEAQARAVIEQSRRRRTVALAASVLVTAGVIGGGWTYLARQQERRTALVDLTLREAEVLRTEAERAGDDLARWATARNAAQSAVRLAADARDAATRQRVTALLQQVTEAEQSAENDQDLLAKLVDIRSAEADDLDGSASDAAYADVFRDRRIDPDALTAAEAGKKIKARPAPVALALAAALDDWAVQRRKAHSKPEEAWRRLVAAAGAADPDPLRNRLRELWSKPDPKVQRESLRKLAEQADPEKWHVQSFNLLAGALVDSGDPDAAENLLRRAVAIYPGDVWVNHELGTVLEKLSRRDEAIRFYTAARAIRPETAHDLAHALGKRGQNDEAIAVFRDLRRLRSGNAWHLACLGEALHARGLSREAREALEAAVSAGRGQVHLKPDAAQAHLSLGLALLKQGRNEEAIAEFRTVIRLKPEALAGHQNLGNALRNQGKLNEAIAELRTAIQLKSDCAEAHWGLGVVLSDQGKLNDAIAEFRTAVRLKPDDAGTHNSLGGALFEHGKLDEAIAELSVAIRLKPDAAAAHSNLALAFAKQGKLDEAIAELSVAIRLKPDDADAHSNLGYVLFGLGKSDEAIAQCRIAIRLAPDFAGSHNTLGAALWTQGKYEEADAEFRTAIRLEPDLGEARKNLGISLRLRGDFAGAVAELRKARDLPNAYPPLRQQIERHLNAAERQAALAARLPAVLRGESKPKDAAERFEFGSICSIFKQYFSSARLFAEALQADPKLADDMKAQNRYNAACAAALAGCGQGKDEPPLDEAAKAGWRKQAIDWLKADLAAWSKILESGAPQAKQDIAQTLQHWKADPDLAGLREPSALAKLPADEQKACRALWAEFDAALRRARNRQAQRS
jgi:serine/threonine-protein kinase